MLYGITCIISNSEISQGINDKLFFKIRLIEVINKSTENAATSIDEIYKISLKKLQTITKYLKGK